MSNTPPGPSPAAGEEWRTMMATPGGPPTAADQAALQAARANIRTLRQPAWHLRLVDPRGRPLVGLPVRLTQVSQAFPVGDHLWPLDAWIRDGREHGERARAWQQRFAALFNTANNLCYWTERPRNDASKVEDRQGEWRLDNFARTVDWCLSQSLLPKGHPLFWSIPKCLPEWVKRYDQPTFWRFAEVRVRNLVARFRGRVRCWDAVNEPLWEAAPGNLAARRWPQIESTATLVDYIAPVLRWARQEDPAALLVINDYGLEEDARGTPPPTGSDGQPVTPARQRARFVALIRALQEAGTPPDALGMQAHTGWVTPSTQWRVYDELASTGLPLQVTEFWVAAEALKALELPPAEVAARVAEQMRDSLTVAYGHPAIQSFYFWGFMEQAITWHGEFSGHELAPCYEAVRQLLHEEWRTRATLTSGDDGLFSTPAFAGDYELSHTLPDGTPWATRLRHDPAQGGPLTVVLPHGGERKCEV